jgi:hypothetical protein
MYFFNIKALVSCIRKSYNHFDILLLMLTCFFWCWNVSFFYVKLKVGQIVFSSSAGIYREFIFPVIFTIPLFFFSADILRKLKLFDYVFFLFYSGLIAWALYSAKTAGWMREDIHWVLVAFPLYFLGVMVKIDQLLIQSIYRWSVCCYFLFIPVFTLYRGVYFDTSNESMTTAYALLPCVLIFVYQTIVAFSFTRAFILATSLILLIGQGNRGTVFNVFTFATLALTLAAVYSNKNFLRLVVVVVAMAAIYLFLPNIVALLDHFAVGKLGMSERVFNLLADDFFNSHGRDVLVQRSWEGIRDNPLGYGFYGDRALLDAYPHRLYLEILLQYGVIFGTIILGYIVYLVIRALNCVKNDFHITLFLVLLICWVFIKLSISGSYTKEPSFFFLLGVCVNIIRHKRNRTPEVCPINEP